MIFLRGKRDLLVDIDRILAIKLNFSSSTIVAFLDDDDDDDVYVIPYLTGEAVSSFKNIAIYLYSQPQKKLKTAAGVSGGLFSPPK